MAHKRKPGVGETAEFRDKLEKMKKAEDEESDFAKKLKMRIERINLERSTMEPASVRK